MHDVKKGTVAVLGSGSWGTALALLLSKNGCQVRLWGPEAQSILNAGENHPYHPGIPLLEHMQVCVDLEAAILGADAVLLAVPSVAFTDVVAQVKATGHTRSLAWATKGLDHTNAQLLSDALLAEWPEVAAMAVLSGPSFAAEVVAEKPSAINVGSNDQDYGRFWCDCLANDYFHAQYTDDIVGVQVGGAVKNVIAIAAGMVDGLGYGANARCALITQGLAEMRALGVALGANPDTFSDLAGIGDLMLTATDDQSRNRRFGLALGGGASLDAAESDIGQVVEGKVTAVSVQGLAKKHGAAMPMLEQLMPILTGESVLDQLPSDWFLP